jgi:FtsP/CotA-like multicopper oxidase with cupredoxin domain
MAHRPVAVVAVTILPFLPFSGESRRVAPVQGSVTAGQSVARALPNDNRVPGGRIERDTLVLRLTVTPADFHIFGDSNPAFRVLAFSEEGRPPTIPGPLIRVRIGTPIQAHLRNPLNETLVVRGLSERGPRDSLIVPPKTTARVEMVARHQGTYLYWATLSPRPLPSTYDTQLAGALVVDPAGQVPGDRVFVITQLADRDQAVTAEGARDRHGTLLRQYGAINGRGWPYTDRMYHALGDSARWRLVNASQEAHPMHLHGFYFRVDAHGTPLAQADSIYSPEQRRMVVTETVGSRQTASIVWSPDQPGGWLFHCHLTSHVVKMPPINQRDVTGFPSTHHHEDPDQHALTGMNGLVLGITVTGRASEPGSWRPSRRLRLFVQSDSAAGTSERRFGYVLQRGSDPHADSVEFPGSMLVLTRGEPTSIEVINRSGEPTAIHWHGIELESYYDGVAGWSGTPGMPGRTTPAVRHGSSFEVRITPKRAGTFMYHTHFDEMRQQYGGLVGPLVVLEPGDTWNPSRDLFFLISDGVPQRVYINGSLDLPTVELQAGRTYRLRLADIAVFRQALRVRLVRHDSLLSWRPVAKDGFTLPSVQATIRPSIVNLPSGETADFEFTPDGPGDVVMEVMGPVANQPAQGRVRFRVSPAVR